MSNLLNLFLHHSFNFDATNYEIYENGCCIQRAKCNTHVSAKHSVFFGMSFEMSNNPTYIDNQFSFPCAIDDLLEDRVQYGRLRPIDYVSGVVSTPIVCNIFPQTGILRFATPNPLRLVEFTGVFQLA